MSSAAIVVLFTTASLTPTASSQRQFVSVGLRLLRAIPPSLLSVLCNGSPLCRHVSEISPVLSARNSVRRSPLYDNMNTAHVHSSLLTRSLLDRTQHFHSCPPTVTPFPQDSPLLYLLRINKDFCSLDFACSVSLCLCLAWLWPRES